MQDTADMPITPAASWRDSLVRSKAQIARGETVALMPVLDDLRSAAERLEAGLERPALGTRPSTDA